MSEESVGKLRATLSVDVKDFIGNLNKAKNSFQQTSSTIASGAKSAGIFDSSMKALNGTLVMAGAGLGAAGISLAIFGKRAFDVANQVEEMDLAIGAVGKSSGLGAEVIRKGAKDIRAMGIEYHSAQEMAMLFVKSNLNVADASKVARVAQDLAVLSQSNSTDTATTLTYAIQTGNSELLKSAGITKYASEAYSAYAKELKIGVNDLSNTQRQQAVLNLILVEGEKVAGVYEAAMKNAGKVMRSFPRIINDIQLEFGKLLTESFGPLIVNSYKIVSAFSKMIREGGVLRPIVEEIGKSISTLLAPLVSASDSALKFITRMSQVSVNAKGVSENITKMIPLVGSLSVGLGLLAGKNIMSAIPMLSKLSSFLIPGGPMVMGIATLIALSPELRAVFLDFIGSLKPVIPMVLLIGKELFEVAQTLVVAFTEIMTNVSGPLSTIIVGLATTFTAVALAVLPVISALASFMGVLGKSKAVVTAFTILMVALILQSKLMGVHLATGLPKAGTRFIASLRAMSANLMYMRGSIISANATFKTTGVTMKLVSAITVTSFTAMKAAVWSFMASLGPMIVMTLAIYAIFAVFQAWGAKNKKVNETTREFTASIIEQTNALIANEEQLAKMAKGSEELASAVDAIQLEALGVDEKEMTKLISDFGTLGREISMIDIKRAESDFLGFASAAAQASGKSKEFSDILASEINSTDWAVTEIKLADGTYYQLSEEEIALAKALEHIQDTVENIDWTKSTQQLGDNLIATGKLTKAEVDHVKQYGDYSDTFKNGTEEVKAMIVATELQAKAIASANDDLAFSKRALEAKDKIAKEHRETVMTVAEAYAYLVEQSDNGQVSLSQLITMIAPALKNTIAWSRSITDTTLQMGKLDAELKASGGDMVKATEASYKLAESLLQITISGEEAGTSANEIAIQQQRMVSGFVASAKKAGYTDKVISQLIITLGILDKLDPTIKVYYSMVEAQKALEVYKALAAALYAISALYGGGSAMEAHLQRINDAVRIAQAAIDGFNQSVGDVGNGGGGSSGETEAERVIGRITDRIKSLKEYMKTLQTSLRGALYPMMNDEGPQGRGQLRQKKDALKDMRLFQQNFKRLKQKGVGKGLLQEFVAAGVQGGNAIAKDILSMSTNDFNEFIALDKKLRRESKDISEDIVKKLFGKDLKKLKLELEIAEEFALWAQNDEAWKLFKRYLKRELARRSEAAGASATSMNKSSMSISSLPISKYSAGITSNRDGDVYNVTVMMPAGSDGESVLKALQKVARQKGSLPLNVKKPNFTYDATALTTSGKSHTKSVYNGRRV